MADGSHPASATPGPRHESVVRVTSWNVAFGGRLRAQRQGELLRELGPDLVFLQEVNPGSADTLRQSAGADWLLPAVRLRATAPGDRPVRRRGVAIAGRGAPPARSWLLEGVQLPERVLLAEISLAGRQVTAISYHAPPGVTWGLVKPRQAVALASWLAAGRGPVLVGADANTPLIDAPDFAGTRTHWHTGDRRLHGEPGDDLMFGPAKIHQLDDVLRRWLAANPSQTAALTNSPLGPLAITHRTRRRKNSPGTGRRFDAIWATPHWTVSAVYHLYDPGIAAGSDHAVVITDLTPARQRRPR